MYHGPSANIGFEVRASNKYGFYAEYGKYIPNTAFSSVFDQKGHTLMAGFKRYFKNGKTYFSLQYLYAKQSYIRSDIIDYSSSSTDYIEYSVAKKIQDFSFHLGKVLVIKKWLTINPFIGYGVRFQDAKISLSEEKASSLKFGNSNDPNNWLHNDGKEAYPKFSIGIRIGVKVF